ncbi:DUF4160 domain-containing protein [Pedobacter aquatilis]
MLTLFIIFGLRFFFYPNEHLPIHIHVRNSDEKRNLKWKMLNLSVIRG